MAAKMKRPAYLLIGAAAALALSLAGCTTSSQDPPEAEQGALGEVETSTDGPADVTEEETPGIATASFGSTYTFSGGIAVTVGEPEAFTVAEEEMPDDPILNHGTPLKFEVTVSNGTDADLAMEDFSVTVLSGGDPAQSEYYTAQGLEMPKDDIAPGGEASYEVAFIVGDAKDLVLTWSYTKEKGVEVEFAS